MIGRVLCHLGLHWRAKIGYPCGTDRYGRPATRWTAKRCVWCGDERDPYVTGWS